MLTMGPTTVFEGVLRSACKKSETGISIEAREVSMTIPPMCNTKDSNNYRYYDMTSEEEVAHCGSTWHWEYLMNPKYSSVGPFLNDTQE